MFTLKKQIEANKVPTEARVGAISPIDFAVPAGPTGLDPSQINFFHALNVSTKIVKGQIEITKDFRVCTIGKKVKASEAALLKKLNLKPFEYGMRITQVYDNGVIVPQEIFNIDPASLLTQFQSGIKNLVGLSLEAGYPIEATVPLIIGNAFKNIAALSLESGYFLLIILDSIFQNSACLLVHNLLLLLPQKSRLLLRPQSRRTNLLRKRNLRRKTKMEEWEDYLIDSEKNYLNLALLH